uniref:Uncharacterized protein n=1 Tax=Brassica campestris TaxID=3711 RepID=A0A3P6ATD9_BRACM|nr:unnamed protein product [Brassica rapa]
MTMQDQIAPIGYIKLPTEMTEYLDNYKYLPKLNNERPDQRNYTYKDRFTSLRNLVLVKICDIVEECIENNLSKDETMRHLWDKYLIPHEYTNIVWNHLERANPDLFISYYARIHERNPQPEICQRILDALDQIQSNTEQIVKLLTDVHGFGPHPSAAVSIKRQRTEEAEERGNSEESEKLQEKKEDGGGDILPDQNLQAQQ